MITLDQAQFIYDNELPDDRFFCDVCEEELDECYTQLDNKIYCDCCFDNITLRNI